MRNTLPFFVMAGVASIASCAGSPHAEELTPRQLLEIGSGKRQHRDLVPLSELEIRDTVVGHRLTVDQPFKQNSTGMSEDFLPDGTWLITRVERSLVKRSGIWRIKGGQMCTQVIQHQPGLKGFGEVCRDVWRERSSGMIATFDSVGTGGDVLIFSVSPL